MAKQVQMWEVNNGDLYEHEDEAIVADALERLQGMHKYLTDKEIELLDKIITDEEFRKAFTDYSIAKHYSALQEQKRNERPKNLQEALDKGKPC